MDIKSFAARLRALRLRSGLSQEILARRLGVSAQSVSKWENAANWPETAAVLPLARLLGVSADELLAEPVERKEWEARWREARKRRDHEALLRVAEAALEDWPADREFRFRRGNEEYQAAALRSDETERLELLRQAKGHLSDLLRDHPGYEEAGVMLVQTLLALGKREEAEAWAGRLPRREKLDLILRQGQAREKALRREIAGAAAELLNLLQSEGSRDACAMTAAILSAAGEPKELIWYRLHLYLRRACLACESGEAEEALLALGELAAAARSFDSSVPSGPTAALFSDLPEAASPPEIRRWVLDALGEECFASLRELEGFAALEEEAAALPP